jgi:hypothetical protein
VKKAFKSGRPIPELDGLSDAGFRDLVEAGRPAVFRGLVRDWPAVKAALESFDALADYLSGLDQGRSLRAVVAPASEKGWLFYNEDLSGFNFRRVEMTLRDALAFLRRAASTDQAETLAIQSVRAEELLPGFAADNPLDIFGSIVEPRLWIGTAATVAAHFDVSENIACAVAGRRRFTLFAPDQTANLYPGPLELTPAGTMISMVDFDDPDVQRHPRFANAMAEAWVADLEPGDAIYIPYLWWHHVRSTAPFNMLVNFWPKQGHYAAPVAALTAGILAMKGLPPKKRAAWDEVFGHYLFERHGPAADHLPVDRRGVLGRLTPPLLERILTRLTQQLSPDRLRARRADRAKEKRKA